MRWRTILRRTSDAIGVALFLVMFGGFLVQIFTRYVLNDPVAWSEEASVVAFIWTTFWAAAFVTPMREHITLDVVYVTVPERARRVMAILTTAALPVVLLRAFPGMLDYVLFMFKKRTPVIGMPFGIVFAPSLVFAAAYATRSLIRLGGLLGRDWRWHL